MFENQGQFDETAAAAPAAGTAVEGSWPRVHVNDNVAEHGPRHGPVDDAWSRVSVVVSRDGLLSAEEISYWNFFAARHEATGGTTTWEGAPSFFEATGGAVPLRTDVTPTSAAKIAATVETGDMPVAPGEFRGVQLDAPVPAHIAVGESVTIAGTVTTMERADFTHACAAWTLSGTFRAQLFERDSIAGNRFSIPHRSRPPTPAAISSRSSSTTRTRARRSPVFSPCRPSPASRWRPHRPRGPCPSRRPPAAERPLT